MLLQSGTGQSSALAEALKAHDDQKVEFGKVDFFTLLKLLKLTL